MGFLGAHGFYIPLQGLDILFCSLKYFGGFFEGLPHFSLLDFFRL